MYVIALYFVGFGGTLITEKNIENLLRMRNRKKTMENKCQDFRHYFFANISEPLHAIFSEMRFSGRSLFYL